METYKYVVMGIIERSKEFINEHLSTVRDNPQILYTVVINENKGYRLLVEQSDLPIDATNHQYKNRLHFYVMLIRGTACYEGYVYLLNPDYHLSLIRVLQEDAFKQRVEWLDSYQY